MNDGGWRTACLYFISKYDFRLSWEKFCSFIHSFIQISFIFHSFIHSFIHTFIHSFIHSLIQFSFILSLQTTLNNRTNLSTTTKYSWTFAPFQISIKHLKLQSDVDNTLITAFLSEQKSSKLPIKISVKYKILIYI